MLLEASRFISNISWNVPQITVDLLLAELSKVQCKDL